MATYDFKFHTDFPKLMIDSLDDYGFTFTVEPAGDWRKDQSRAITVHIQEERVPEALNWTQQFFNENITEEMFDNLILRKL
ncbi:hypothetical protein AU106_gp069 [Sinorhizobium phage phiM9]|uniref:Uncharacterized protein n=1 Tax=Sinorhizobium phage phiM9 TaxID=1636182 RepID=A0A0F6R5T4_9CAUD|nr:hypothetical protein AU106_gp069 [Sinorhizobium phage phiM9]AKE44700.1 hypothetical protein Sm_phiM9_070 [Sinorhizobium phage phiM9]